MKNYLQIFDFSQYLSEIHKNFGIKFILLCLSTYIGIKGALLKFAKNIELPFYRNGKWDSTEYQTNMAISSAPMTLKGICGILSDILPIFGYEKSAWFIIYTIIGFVACLVFVLFPMTKDNIFLGIPGLLFLCIQIECAFLDLLTEAKYVELMNRNAENRGNIIIFTYLCITLGEILPIFLVGSLDGILEVNYIFLIFLPFAAQPLIFILTGCMVDDRASMQRNNRIDFVKLKSQKYIMTLAFVMFMASSISVIFALFFDSIIQFIYVAIAGFFCSFISYYFLPRVAANVNFYIFFTSALFLNLTGPLEYYYLAEPDCVKNGPNFDLIFIKTYAGIGAIFAKFIGIWVFHSFLTRMRFRLTYWLTTLIRVFASLGDIMIITRFNLRIGIPDHVMYFLGNAIITEMSYMMDHLPSAIIMAKLSPKHVEGTVFAILAGFGNFGQNVARFAGSFVMELFGVVLDDTYCNIDNFVLIIIIGHLILPILGIPLTFLLIPNTYVRENLDRIVYKDTKFYHTSKQNPV